VRIVAVRPELGVRERDGQLHVRLRSRLRRRRRGNLRGRRRVRAIGRRLRRQRQVHEHSRVARLYVSPGIHRVRQGPLPKLVAGLGHPRNARFSRLSRLHRSAWRFCSAFLASSLRVSPKKKKSPRKPKFDSILRQTATRNR